MMNYTAERYGHLRNQRKAILKMGLVTEEELVLMSDDEVTQRINSSNYLIFRDGDDYAFIPKELYDRIIWINR